MPVAPCFFAFFIDIIKEFFVARGRACFPFCGSPGLQSTEARIRSSQLEITKWPSLMLRRIGCIALLIAIAVPGYAQTDSAS
jgi:hypothetical protein